MKLLTLIKLIQVMRQLLQSLCIHIQPSNLSDPLIRKSDEQSIVLDDRQDNTYIHGPIAETESEPSVFGSHE